MTAEPPGGLYDRPVLVIDPGMHTSQVWRADVDQYGRFLVTASEDKTVRIWSLADGHLMRTIRLPAGDGDIGKVYALAISPDGTTIATGGMTRAIEGEEQIYLFDRATGDLIARVEGLPDTVNDLAFSRDGDRLAAVLAAGRGSRLYGRGAGDSWSEVAIDDDYADAGYGVAFAVDGRFATTSRDGLLRLYDRDGNIVRKANTPIPQPHSLCFNEADGRLAVGFVASPVVLVADGRSMEWLGSPDLSGLDNGHLGSVAWSQRGDRLFAAGAYQDNRGRPVIAWDGSGARHGILQAGTANVVSLRPLPGGELAVAAGDPWLGVLAVDGSPLWTKQPAQIDLRGQERNLGVSSDGSLVEFGLRFGGDSRLRFDVSSLKLLPPADDGNVGFPLQDGLAIAGWRTTGPTLNGAPLLIEQHERARSLAVHPDRARFLLGTGWWLRAFDKAGAALWTRSVPDAVWAVNISGDGRLVVAAYGDGTIRWHRMEGGAELLALFPMPDGENWVVWTPEGVYAASPEARSVLRWHVNHGWERAATAVPASAIPETHRREVIPHVLPRLGTAGALAAAELAKISAAVERETASDVSPGARLHVLAIGISDYGAAAPHLELAYAHQDARDFAAALRNSQRSLYTGGVLVRELVDADATREAVLRELRAIERLMEKGTQDLAIVLFAGHGDMVDRDEFFLLPYGVDDRSAETKEASALSAVQFHNRLAAMAHYGRVIVFLDACRSGGATRPIDRSLRAILEAPGVNVFTSCSPGELSVEDDAWQNGAFTEALLEALGRDPDGDGLVWVGDLSSYLTHRVPVLTGGEQHPDVEIHFECRILVATG